MVEKWGYKLPLHPNDKSYRACYRASSKHCLIQDISYYSCLQVAGKLDEIIDGLNRHCSNECGLTFNSTHLQSGCYEGSVFVYECDKYPKGAIGEVKYIWDPQKAENSMRAIWLWCHPSIYNQVLEELVKTFSLELEESMLVDDDIEDTKDVEKTKLKCRNVPFVKTPKYTSTTKSICMVLLKDTLNRFRLIGPLSQALVINAFKPIDLEQRSVKDWAQNYFKQEGPVSCKKQLDFWKKMTNFSSPGQISRHLILSAIVADPRFTLPSGRKKPESNIEDLTVQSLLNTEPELSRSAIWSSDIRDEVTDKILSTHQINDIRSNKLVPGLDVESKDTNLNNLPAVPILLIQNPGDYNDIKPLGYGSGWDIIVPSGYGVPVWLALNLHGGRAGGLKEFSSIAREQCKILFPPDSVAGKLENKFQLEEGTDTYFRLPPAKRQNYVKLGIPSPFYPPWEILMNDWVGERMFHVLRNRNKLMKLNKKLMNLTESLIVDENDFGSLVPVIVALNGKGTLVRNSHICLPVAEDFQKLNDIGFSGPVEPQHNDIYEAKRNICRSDHKTMLKRLSRKRQQERRSKGKEAISTFRSEEIVTQQREVMRELWLPECTTVKNHCSRTILGFVSDADFSFTSAKTVGVGFVALKGLMQLFEVLVNSTKHNSHVLVRNINSSQYRFAQLRVIL